jgi:DNA-binding response OmpR family regulator
MRVLLVDDEEELVSTLAERLSMRGIEADWATSAEQALCKVAAVSYDVAVLDVKLPKISGLELKKRLEDKAPGMKFIFVTGHGSEEDFRTGSAEAGEGYYLMKPVNIEALVRKMDQAIRGTEEQP